MSEIKAIQTSYKGWNFRSRLEARWAVFFEAMGYEFHYEPEGFQLESGWYLPDFYLPKFHIYCEVKPIDFNAKEKSLANELARQCSGVAKLIGPPDFKGYELIYYCGLEPCPHCKDPECGYHQYDNQRLWFLQFKTETSFYMEMCGGYFEDGEAGMSCYLPDYPKYRNAVYASRAARFDKHE